MIKISDFTFKSGKESDYYSLKRDGIKYKLTPLEFGFEVLVIAGNEKLKPKTFETAPQAVEYITLLCKLNNIDTYATTMEEYKTRSTN